MYSVELQTVAFPSPPEKIYFSKTEGAVIMKIDGLIDQPMDYLETMWRPHVAGLA